MRDAARRHARRKGLREDRQRENRTCLYDEVTARIITELEAGRLPWVQPWGATGSAGPGLPRNALTARAYSGINVLILWGAVIEHGWPSQSWLTFRQAQEAGGCVRKGERGHCVVYADRFTPEAEKARAEREGGEAKAVPFLKRFTVFNVAQCEGLREGLASDPAPLPEREIVPVAEEVIAASGIDFRIGGNRAFYVPNQDFVQVPPQPAFFEQVNYYRTCLHELTHATGHAKRLGPCLIQQSEEGFGLVSIDDQPWIAKKVKERERALDAQLKAIPAGLAPGSDELRKLSKQFYTDLRETWERAVEEVVLGGVVERFGTDVKTQSLKLVDIDDEDYRVIYFAMKRASERSGHDQAAAKQIDAPDKAQMESDFMELRGFIATHRKKNLAASERRKDLEHAPKGSVA